MTTLPTYPGFRPAALGCLVLLLAAQGSCHGHKSSSDDSAQELLLQAESAMARGDLPAALEAYRSAAKKDPDPADTWNRLGLALEYRFYATGDDAFRDEALAAYRKATKRDHDCRACMVNEANLLWVTGDKRNAAKLYERVLDKAPNHPDAQAMKRRIRMAASQQTDVSKKKGATQ